MIKMGRFFVLVAVLLIFSAGCAVKVPVHMLKPANYHEAAMSKTVAVVPFDGRGGREFASEIEGVLGSINIDDRQYFTLVDRTSLDKVMSEMKFSHSGLVDPSKAVELGKMVGAQGIYTGTVQRSFKSSYYRENRQECARYEEYKDKKGRTQQGKCLSYRRWNVNCTKNALTFVCNPKLVEVKTARVLYARNLSGYAEDGKCEDVGTPRSEGELLEAAKAQVKTGFRRDIAPYYETRMVKLMDSTDGMASQEASEKLKQGITWAEKRRLDKACELWGEAASLTSTSYSLAYNLGVCAESRADVAAANRLYKKAEDLLGKHDDDVSQAVIRTAEAVKNAEKLSQQMKSLEYEESRVAPASAAIEESAEEVPPPKKKKKK